MLSRLKFLVVLVALLIPLCAANQPVYVQLVLDLDDHLNFQLSLNRLDRTLALLERLQTSHPQLRPTCLVNVTGASAAWLQSLRPHQASVQKLFRLYEQGAVEIGYSGFNEPTPSQWPQTDFRRARTAGQRWVARTRALDLFLTEYKDPHSGDPDPDRSGGLKLALRIFPGISMVGGVARDLGGQPELAALLRGMSIDAVMAGLPEPSHHLARRINGYRGGHAAFATDVSPDPGTAPQLYSQDGFIHWSDSTAADRGLLRATDTLEATQKRWKVIPRTNVQFLRLVLCPTSFHLKPNAPPDVLASPIRWAYDNPKERAIAVEHYLDTAAVDANYRRQDAIVDFLLENMPQDGAGSRFVSSRDLLSAVRQSEPAVYSRQEALQAAGDLLRRWGGNNHPPTYAAAGSRFLSLASVFYLLTAAVAEPSQPIMVRPVYGPAEMEPGQGPPPAEVSRRQIEEAARQILPVLRSDAVEGGLPANRIPGSIPVGPLTLNSAQFLRLLAELIVEPRETLSTRTSQMAHGFAYGMPSTRPSEDRGTTWTIQPVRVPKLAANVASN